MSGFSFKGAVRNNRGAILFLFLMYFFKSAYADWSPVPSGSMEPTIHPGDFLWVDKTSYGPSLFFFNKQVAQWGNPSRGDVITFLPPHTDQLYVKRVIGVPGDSLRIEGANVFVNGAQLEYHLESGVGSDILGREVIDGREHQFKLSGNKKLPYIGKTIEIPEGKYFVMGDHRNDSLDSRYWGLVDRDRVMGKVTSLAFSFSKERDFFSSVAMPLK
ncbi:signal peptidase I [Microbulbifer sp. CNSA002]|uniref:signal peptidase I n=1 Tax=unclassified Microbulbifer TaxID=2619833 RepID=UPI0039B66E3B